MSPFISGLFLAFAGMFIGYFFRYRDRSGDEAQLRTFAQDNESLRASLKLAHNSHEQLDERFTRQKGQLNVLQQLCDDWSNSREQAERERAELEVEVGDKNRRFEEATAELQQEKEKRVALEDASHQQSQLQITKVSELEDDWRQRHSKVESTLVQRQADFKSSKSENERLAKQLHQSESRIAELKADLATQESHMATASKNASGLEQEYVSLESSLQESSERLRTSRAECASALSAKKVAEESLEELKSNHESAQLQIEELEARLSEMESLASQVVSLQEVCAAGRVQLEKVSAQRDETMTAEKQVLTQAAGLQKRIDNQEATIHGLRAKHDSAMENLKQELEKRVEIESRLQRESNEWRCRFDERTENWERESGERSSKFLQENTELQSRVAKQQETIEQLTSKSGTEHTALSHRLQLQSESIQRLTSECQALKSNVERSTERFETAQTELETAHRQTSKLTSKVEELKITCLRISELEKLVQRRDQEDHHVVAELRTLREQYASSYAKQKELRAELDRVAGQRIEFESVSDQHDQQLVSLKTKLKASEETIRTLRRERSAVLARLASYRTVSEPDATVISFTEAMQRRQKDATYYDQEYGGHASHHAVRGVVYTETPESRDDLKLISGIAEVLEARLNDYGVYTFKQIMDWRPEAIEEFSRLLAFRDRIERDDWLKQAKFFYDKNRKRSVAA